MANIQVNRSGLIAPEWDRRSGPDRLRSCKFGAQLSRKLRELDTLLQERCGTMQGQLVRAAKRAA